MKLIADTEADLALRLPSITLSRHSADPRVSQLTIFIMLAIITEVLM